MTKIHKLPSVLIVDDLATSRRIMRDMLEEMGFSEIFESADCATAAEYIYSGKIGIVICDYAIEANKTGVDLLRLAQTTENSKNIPFLFVSGRADISAAEGAIRLGASAWMMKPASYPELRCKVSEMIEKAYLLSKENDKYDYL
jgi:two-component system chemotaxis response regulator CheY